MAAIKGERIATNLLGRIVTPRIEDSERGTAWPAAWPSLPPGGPAGTSGRLAEVTAVYVVEGHVRLLLRNLVNGHLTDGDALDWKVVR